MHAREFTLEEGKTSKFWRISVTGSSHTVTYGRIGTEGRTVTKSFGSPAEAKAAAQKLVAAKLKKGYGEAKTASKKAVKQVSKAAAVAAAPKKGKARKELLSNLQNWVATDLDIDVESVDFAFIPDFESENWFEAAVLRGQEFGPALNVGTVFGGCLTTLHNVERGDIICDQYAGKERRRVLWVHDEGYYFTDGGDPDADPELTTKFAQEWEEYTDDLEEALRALPNTGKVTNKMLAALKPESGELLEAFRSERAEQIPGVRRIHQSNYTTEVINEGLERMFPSPKSKPYPKALPDLLMGASMVVRNLCVGRSLPTAQDAQAWRDQLDADFKAGVQSRWGPLSILKVLWQSYFMNHRLDDMIELANRYKWRVMRDAASLVVRLRTDPKLGSLTMVTTAGQAEQVAAQAAARREADEQAQAAEEERRAEQERIAKSGSLVLELVTAQPQLTPLKIFARDDLPEFVKNENLVFQHEHSPQTGNLKHGWAGRTESGRWVVMKQVRSATQAGGYGTTYDYRLLTGMDSLSEVDGLGDQTIHSANPLSWYVRGDVVYTTQQPSLEIDLSKGEVRTYEDALAQETDVGDKIYRKRYWLTGTGIGCVESVNHKRSLALYQMAAGGEPALEEKGPLDFEAADYDMETDTLVVSTWEHGIWCLRLVEKRWSVLHRVRADFSKPARSLRIATGLPGIYVQDGPCLYKLVNLDRLNGTGISLRDACADPSSLDAVSSDPLKLER